MVAIEPTSHLAPTVGRAATRIGQLLTALLTVFLLADAIPKLARMPFAVQATQQLGFPPTAVPVIGGLLLGSLVLYLIPRTAVLGAVLLTGYLGGALCAQLRIEAPLFTHLLVPIYVGVLVWAALYPRSAALRTLVRASTG